MFRDQSQETVIRSETTNRTRVRKRSPSSEPTKDWASSQSAVAAAAAPFLIASPKLDKDRGLIDFFANNFACSDCIGVRNNLFWIPRDFDAVLKNDSVRFSAQAAGAMALARLQRSAFYIGEAHEKYSTALLSLVTMGREIPKLKRDAFSLAAMFLGFFEILADYDSSSRASWRTHLGGIVSLYETCDEQYLHTDLGSSMFRQTRSQVLIHALQAHRPVPEAFMNSNQSATHPVSSHFKPFDNVDVLLICLANLQAQFRTTGASTTLVSELVALNAACCRWMENLPPHWSFSEQPAKVAPESWWDAREDVYSSGFIAHTWCKVRATRIAAYDLIQESLETLSDLRAKSASEIMHQSGHELSSERVRELATDICATIPSYYHPSMAAVDPNKRPNPPALGATFWLLWVMEVVGSMREAPLELTVWVVRCFDWIYQCTGIAKIQLVAYRLRSGHRGPILP